jgi:hypothetical protein
LSLGAHRFGPEGFAQLADWSGMEELDELEVQATPPSRAALESLRCSPHPPGRFVGQAELDGLVLAAWPPQLKRSVKSIATSVADEPRWFTQDRAGFATMQLLMVTPLLGPSTLRGLSGPTRAPARLHQVKQAGAIAQITAAEVTPEDFTRARARIADTEAPAMRRLSKVRGLLGSFANIRFLRCYLARCGVFGSV